MIFPVTFIEDTHTPQFETAGKLEFRPAHEILIDAYVDLIRAETSAKVESARRSIGQLTRTDRIERREFWEIQLGLEPITASQAVALKARHERALRGVYD